MDWFRSLDAVHQSLVAAAVFFSGAVLLLICGAIRFFRSECRRPLENMAEFKLGRFGFRSNDPERGRRKP